VVLWVLQLHAGALSKDGVDVINYVKVIPTFLFIFFAPLIGMFIAFWITIFIVHLFKRSNPYKAETWFKRLQLASVLHLVWGMAVTMLKK
jgi:PiT family inorganic phosphate transporter